MAKDNVDSLIYELYDYKEDIKKIPDDNKLITFIIGLEQLANDASAFGGKIAQICPAKIREQKSILENALKQLNDACSNVSNGLNGLVEVLENMPLKDLRGVMTNPTKAKAEIESSIGIDTNGVSAQSPVIAPNAATASGEVSGPKSAMLQQQNESSVWSSLKKGFKFTESVKTGFDWNSISQNVDQLGIDVSATTEAPKMGLFESIISNGGIPKSAGDLNSKPDPRDAYDYNSEYADVLPGELPHYAESSGVIESEPSIQKLQESKKPASIDEQGHELFEHVDTNAETVCTTSLKEALSSFNGKEFDFNDIDLPIESMGDSLEGHFIE